MFFREDLCWIKSVNGGILNTISYFLGIKPAGSKWNPEATKRFHKCTSGMKLQARITSFSRDGAGVELIDNSMGHPKVISEMLISEKLAVKEELQDKNTSPSKSDEKGN